MRYAEQYRRFRYWANWWRIVWLLLACMGCTAGFQIRAAVLAVGAKETPGPGLDGRKEGYSPDDIREYFRQIGPQGKDLYATTQMSLDLLFPILYGTLFFAVTARLCTVRFGKWWVAVPLLGVLCDLGENTILILLANDTADPGDNLAHAACCFTIAKWLLLKLALVGIAGGGICRWAGWWSDERLEGRANRSESWCEHQCKVVLSDRVLWRNW